jgi:hypothetical protein
MGENAMILSILINNLVHKEFYVEFLEFLYFSYILEYFLRFLEIIFILDIYLLDFSNFSILG